MPLDPSIILEAGNINDPAKLMSLKDMAMKLRQQEQAAQSQNMLKQLFANPSALDKSGNLTPQAMGKVMQVDPETGMELRKQQLATQVQQMELEHDKTKIGAQKFDLYGAAAAAGVDAYNDAKKLGKSDSDATSAATAARNGVAKNNGGILSDDDVNRVSSSPFVLDQATALAGTDKDWTTRNRQDRVDTRAEAAEGEKERHDRATEERMAAALAGKPDPTANKWEVLTDPKTNGQYRYNPETAQSTTLDGKPYTPGGAAKIAAGGGSAASEKLNPEALDAAAEIYRKTGKLPPMYRDSGTRIEIMNHAGELSKAAGQTGSDVVAQQSAVKSDSSSLTNITKIADSAEAYENTALKNMDIVREKMPKGQATNFGPWIDKWIQGGRIATGDPDVPPYATALVTVANEYAKVMSGSTGAQGSTVDSRREAAELLNKAQTTDQINNVLDVMREDMENKKSSYRDQRAEIEGRIKNGDKKPEAKPSPPKAASDIKAITSKDEKDALPSGAHYSLPGDEPGTYRTKP